VSIAVNHPVQWHFTIVVARRRGFFFSCQAKIARIAFTTCTSACDRVKGGPTATGRTGIFIYTAYKTTLNGNNNNMRASAGEEYKIYNTYRSGHTTPAPTCALSRPETIDLYLIGLERLIDLSLGDLHSRAHIAGTYIHIYK